MASVLLKYANPNTIPRAVNTAPVMDTQSQILYRDLKKLAGQVSRSPGVTPSILRYADASLDFSKPMEESGGGGGIPILGPILGNSVVRTALKPLSLLSIPKNVVLSTIKEIGDLGDSKEKFSFSDWFNQVKDPTFGGGNVFGKTGNVWLDRIIGFGTDVVFDPLVWTGLGAGRYAGAGGRVALSSDLAAVNAPANIINKAGKFGLPAIRQAEREAVQKLGLNLPDAGIYFGSSRIGGTGIAGEALGALGSRLRYGLFTNTPLGRVMRRASTPEADFLMAESILTDKGPYTRTLAAGTLGVTKRGNGVLNRFIAEEGKLVDEIAPTINPADNKIILDELESVGLTGATPTNPSTARVRDFFDTVFKRLEDKGVDIKYRTNYIPHIWTDEGRAILQSDTALGVELRRFLNITKDQVASPSILEKRVFDVGQYNIAGRNIDITTGSVSEINQKLAQTFPELMGKKVLNDDVVQIMKLYLIKAAKAYQNKVIADDLVKLGIGRNEADAAVQQIDQAATKKAQSAARATAVKEAQKQASADAKVFNETKTKLGASLKKLDARLKSDAKLARTAGQTARGAVNKELSSIEKELQTIYNEINAYTRALNPLQEDIQKTGAQLGTLARKDAGRTPKLKKIPILDANGNPIKGKFEYRVNADIDVRERLMMTRVLRERAQSAFDDLVAKQRIAAGVQTAAFKSVRNEAVQAQRLLNNVIELEQILESHVDELAQLEASYGLYGMTNAGLGPDVAKVIKQDASSAVKKLEQEYQRVLEERATAVRSLNSTDGLRQANRQIDDEIRALREQRALKPNQRKKISIKEEVPDPLSGEIITTYRRVINKNADIDARIAELQVKRINNQKLIDDFADPNFVANQRTKIQELDTKLAEINNALTEARGANLIPKQLTGSSDAAPAMLTEYKVGSGIDARLVVGQNAQRAAENILARTNGREMLHQGRGVLETFAPEQMSEIDDALRGIRDALSIRAKNERIRNEYDDIERIKQQYLRESELKIQIEEQIKLNKGRANVSQQRFLNRFENETKPAYDSVGQREFAVLNLESEPDLAPFYARIENAKVRARESYMAGLNRQPYLAQTIKDRMGDHFQYLLDSFVQGDSVLRRFNTRNVMDVGTATNLAKEMNIVGNKIEQAVFNLRLQHDFSYRFARAKNILLSRNIAHQDDVLGNRVLIEVLKDFDTKVAAREKNLLENYNNMLDSVSRSSEARASVRSVVENNVDIISTLLDDYRQLARTRSAYKQASGDIRGAEAGGMFVTGEEASMLGLGWRSSSNELDSEMALMRRNIAAMIFGDEEIFASESAFAKFLSFIEYQTRSTTKGFFSKAKLESYLTQEANTRFGVTAEKLARTLPRGQERAAARISGLDMIAEEIKVLRLQRADLMKMRAKLGQGNQKTIDAVVGADNVVLARRVAAASKRAKVTAHFITTIEDDASTLGWRFGVKAVPYNQTQGVEEVVQLIDEASAKLREATVRRTQVQETIDEARKKIEDLDISLKGWKQAGAEKGVIDNQINLNVPLKQEQYQIIATTLELRAAFDREIADIKSSIELLNNRVQKFAFTGGETRTSVADWREMLFGVKTSAGQQEINDLYATLAARRKRISSITFELEALDASVRSGSDPSGRLASLETELQQAARRETQRSALEARPDLVARKGELRQLEVERGTIYTQLSELKGLDPEAVDGLASQLESLHLRSVQTKAAMDRAAAKGDPNLASLIDDDIKIQQQISTMESTIAGESEMATLDRMNDALRGKIDGERNTIARLQQRTQPSLRFSRETPQGVKYFPEDKLSKAQADNLVKQARTRIARYENALSENSARLAEVRQQYRVARQGIGMEGAAQVDERISVLVGRLKGISEAIAERKAYIDNAMGPYAGRSRASIEAEIRRVKAEVQKWNVSLSPEQAKLRRSQLAAENDMLVEANTKSEERLFELLNSGKPDAFQNYYTRREELFAQIARARSDLYAQNAALIEPVNRGAIKTGSMYADTAGTAKFSDVFDKGFVRPKVEALETAKESFDAFQRSSNIPTKYREIQDFDRAIAEAEIEVGAARDLRVNDAVDVADRQRKMFDLQQRIQQDVARLEAMPAGALTAENVALHNDLIKWLDDARALMNTTADATTFNQVKSLLARTPGVKPSEVDQFAALVAGKPSLERDVTLNLIERSHVLAGELLTQGGALRQTRALVDAAKNADYGNIVVYQTLSGWDAIAKTGVVVPTEVRTMLQNIVTLRDPKKWAGFVKAWDSYNNVFKAYATLSPRFHVRNAMSATFMNFADGVSGSNMLDGVRLWRNFVENPKGWESTLSNLSAQQLKEVDEAITAVFMSGGGQYAEISAGARGTRNRVVKMSRKIGTDVEGSVRLGMALDTIRNGGTVNEAAARITRIHFDYSNISDFDRTAKRLIPFYTFMRYNLPLQVQMMWTKPRAYSIYNSFVQNFKGEDNAIVPSSLGTAGMFKAPFGSDFYINPDLGFSRIEEDLKMVADPTKLIGSTTPLLKVPLELWAGKQFYKDIPLDENKFIPLSGVAAVVAPVLETMGLVETNADGQKVISQKTAYAVQQLFPYANTIDRLTGVGKNADRQRSNLLGFIGLPFKEVSAGERQSEIYRRMEALRNIQIRQSGLGY